MLRSRAQIIKTDLHCSPMKRIIAFLFFAAAASAQTPTLVNLLSAILKCPVNANYFIMSMAGTLTCVPLPPNITVSNANPPLMTVVIPPSTDGWTTESVSLSAVAPGSTTMNYTTSKTPINGVVFITYNTKGTMNNTLYVVGYTGEPLSFTLPANWSPGDTMTVTYQYQ